MFIILNEKKSGSERICSHTLYNLTADRFEVSVAADKNLSMYSSGVRKTYRKNINDSLEEFLESEENILCIASSYVMFETFTPGPLRLLDEFRLSYKVNGFPVQAAFIEPGLNSFAEDDFVYHSTSPQTDCIIATKDIVKKTGFVRNNSLALWIARANTISGRYPEDFIILKHSYRYISLQKNSIIEHPDTFSKEDLRNIYIGEKLYYSWQDYLNEKEKTQKEVCNNS